MKNKLKMCLFVMFISIITLGMTDIHAAEINKSKINTGVIGVSHSAPGKKLKVMVAKGGKKYTYNLRNDGKTDYYPLQLGSGTYKITVLQNVSGNKYTVLKSESVDAAISNANIVYLNSIQIIDWTNDSPAIKKAKSLNNQKSVYDYIVKNIKYDYGKANSVKPGYDPNINDTFKTNKGICYDYSSMDAAMLRSLGVPTKLVKGYAKGVDGYHAWNEVFLNGQWYVIDTTYDSTMYNGKAKYTMKKKTSDYRKVYEY